jgi:hypothetical protein
VGQALSPAGPQAKGLRHPPARPLQAADLIFWQVLEAAR